MLQFILGAIGVVALSEISKKGKMPKMAHGGGVDMESIEEEIRSLKSRIKSLEEINTKEAYEQSNKLRKQLSYLQAKYNLFAKGGGVGIDYNKFLKAKTDQYRKEGYGLIDAIDTAFRDLGLETEGKFEKREFDKVVASNPNVKKAWTNYKKESSIYVKDGYYVNPYQMEYAKGGGVGKLKTKNGVEYTYFEDMNPISKKSSFFYRIKGATLGGMNFTYVSNVKLNDDEIEKVAKQG